MGAYFFFGGGGGGGYLIYKRRWYQFSKKKKQTKWKSSKTRRLEVMQLGIRIKSELPVGK